MTKSVASKPLAGAGCEMRPWWRLLVRLSQTRRLVPIWKLPLMSDPESENVQD